MEYPNTRFTRIWRLILLVIFIIIFLIVAPVTLFYSEGYRFNIHNWKNGFLKEAGGLSIDEITPTTIKMAINGVTLNNKLPIRLKNIAPNFYNIELSAPGYLSWQKTVEVKNKQAVYIKQLNLIKKSEPKFLLTGQFSDLAVSPNGRFIFYVALTGKNKEARLLDKASSSTFVIAVAAPNSPIKTAWDKSGANLAVAIGYPYQKLFVLPAEKTRSLTDLVALNKKPINKFVWDGITESDLYFSDATNIYTFSPLTKQVRGVAKNTYTDWLMANGQLWTLIKNTTSTGFKLTRDTLGFSNTQTILAGADDAGQFGEAGWMFLDSSLGDVLLQNNTSDKYIIISNAWQYEVNANNYFISRYNNWWVFWNQLEIWTYLTGQNPILLNRSGEKLNQVVILDKFNTMALIWNKKITALFPYYLNEFDWQNAKINSAAADSEKRFLYFSGAIKNQIGLWQLAY